jgi:hypothetical protein
MARRPERNEKKAVLTAGELEELQKRLAGYQRATLEAFYRSAHNRCSLQPRWIPSPKAMQELISGVEGTAEGAKTTDAVEWPYARTA